MKKNLLKNTRVYLIGHMQYASGRSWREYAARELNPRGIVTFDPYLKPFVKDIEDAAKEDENTHAHYAKLLEAGDLLTVQKKFEKIRSYDLSLVDRADFIIGHLYPKIASWGTAEELTRSLSGHKGCYLSIEGGRSQVPFWLLGMFPEQCFYNKIEDVVEHIKAMDDGTVEIPHDIWRLLALPKPAGT